MAIGSAVVVVDDNEDDVRLTQTLLEKAGGVAEVLTFTTGDALIEYFSEIANHPSEELPLAVLFDLKMPGFTGLELLEWMSPCLRPSSNRGSLVVIGSTRLASGDKLGRAVLFRQISARTRGEGDAARRGGISQRSGVSAHFSNRWKPAAGNGASGGLTIHLFRRYSR